ncbi:MAG: efflux RND transporter periplasmic adaptor subunit [Myxococcales bacterium]|nr:efflux RND transporter periplasmic adaptor subunit [Myxococcales bacterium]
MIGVIFICLAFGHGGEDHGAPAAPVTTSDVDSISVTTSSRLHEGVLRVTRGSVGSAVATTLLLSDFATSAPISDANVSVALLGPATATIALTPASPGTYTGTATFAAEGDYAGAVVVTRPAVSDVLSLTGLHIGDAEPAATALTALTAETAETAATSLSLLGILGGLTLLGGAGVLAVGIGYAIGRARGAAAAALLLAASMAARQVSAAPDTSKTLHLPMTSQFLVGLRTSPLVRDTFQERVPALAHFVARAGGSATLRAPAAGELAAPQGGFPAPGSAVHAGQLLGTLRGVVGSADRAGLAESRQQAATAVAEAKKSVVLAERDVAQVSVLADGISDRERLDRDQSLAVARTALAESESALSAIGDGAGIAIRAPVDGRLGTVLARPGDQVQAGDPLFRVVDASGLWLEARVPERLAVGVTAGSGASVSASAFPGLALIATILDAGQEADPRTGTVTVTLAVEGAGLDLRPGMSATAWLGRGPARDALVVPDAAVVDSNGMTLGFVKVGPEQFELRELKLGARSGESWEVLSGLKVGERVVTDGTYTLRSVAGR